jgi:class 3 adenylate cyclase
MPRPIPLSVPDDLPIHALRVSKVRARRSLLCSDIVGFTRMLGRLGDVAALHVVRRHDEIVSACAAAHGGEVLELRGDGFLVSFTSRAGALACAIDIQRELAADRAAHDDGGVHVRIGVHTGDMFVERGRYFGLEVVVPFRLLEVTGADEILATGDGLADEGSGVSLRGVRDLDLDGIPRRVSAVEVEWRFEAHLAGAGGSAAGVFQ